MDPAKPGPERTTLAHVILPPAGAAPARYALWLHGVFGSGQNFRSVAKAVSTAAPGWGTVLVDLRAHGASRALSPPHTLTAAARDLEAVVAEVPGPVGAVIGHSFGGKVALRFVERFAPSTLERLVLLDSSPSARPDALGRDTAGRVLAMLESVAWPLASREAFVEHVTGRGYERGIADWLAMNVRRAPDGFRLRNDLHVIRAMLEDYFATDLWAALEDPAGPAVTVVVGGRSAVWGEEDLARLALLAERRRDVEVVRLEAAGHWVHADDPAGVTRAVTRALTAS
jgi:esterase